MQNQNAAVCDIVSHRSWVGKFNNMRTRYDFVMRLLESIGVKVKKPMILEVDNEGAKDLTENWSWWADATWMSVSVFCAIWKRIESSACVGFLPMRIVVIFSPKAIVWEKYCHSLWNRWIYAVCCRNWWVSRWGSWKILTILWVSRLRVMRDKKSERYSEEIIYGTWSTKQKFQSVKT